MSRCDFCIEENCGGSKDCCNCESCSKVTECYRFLHPTIRITNKCTQECSHCCFSSSPTRTEMMTLETADIISEFLVSNEIMSLNVMGGEFFCNPNWFGILHKFLSTGAMMRLVTNADWGTSETVKNDLIRLKDEFGNHLRVSVSNDRWHTNKYVSIVEEFLRVNGFNYNVGTKENDDVNVIVPVGRSEFECFNIYGMFACYCHNPQHMYSFLIDEVGKIYKCSFGVFDYATVDKYKDGGFAKRFKEFNKVFYDTFIPSCKSCVRYARQNNAIIK